MIYSLNGELVYTEPGLAVIECAGVGYGVRTTLSTLSQLPKPGTGKKATVFTYLYVREDVCELFGFYDQNELNCFKLLLSVSGVGPKAALAILSELTPDRFALCVVSGDSKALIKAPGIGSKIAQRIVLELKDKLSKEQLHQPSAASGVKLSAQTTTSNAAEAITALTVLGYSQAEATTVVAKLDPTMSVEEMIKRGLGALAGGMR